jgi:RNA-binding protein
MPLSKNQIKFLRAKCHDLKPVVLMGQKGLTEELLNELDHALNDHELVKIKLSADDKQARAQLITEICDRSNSETIQTIGKVLSVYRANPDKHVINLPKD